MSADEHGVSFTVTNTGTVAGSEVAQIYISKTDSAIFRPIKELKAFARVTLAPGEKQRVSILLDDKAFRFWNVKSNRWETEGGRYEILVGASVQDIRLQTAVVVKGTATVFPYDDAALGCYKTADVKNVSDEAFAALVDRLTYRSHVLDMSGPSYRLLTAQAENEAATTAGNTAG